MVPERLEPSSTNKETKNKYDLLRPPPKKKTNITKASMYKDGRAVQVS